MAKNKGKDVIFFDGACGFCNRWVRFALERDQRDAFRAAPIGGVTYRRLLPEAPLEADGVILRLRTGRVYRRAEAIRQIVGRLGGGYRGVAVAMSVMPSRVWDVGYAAVARVLHRLAPPAERCPMPSARVRGKLLV